jgi:hypothetical protein
MFAFYNSFDAEKAGIMLVKFIFHVEKKVRHQKKDAHDSNPCGMFSLTMWLLKS